MTTTSPLSSEIQPPVKAPYQPTPEQLERAAAQRRFNALFVYAPMVFFSLLLLGFVGVMIYFAVVRESWRGMVSAVADLLVILAILPTLLLCAILPAGSIGLFVYGRRQEWTPYKTIQVLFWRLDSLVVRVQTVINTAGERIAPYIVRFRATFVRVETTVRILITGEKDE